MEQTPEVKDEDFFADFEKVLDALQGAVNDTKSEYVPPSSSTLFTEDHFPDGTHKGTHQQHVVCFTHNGISYRYHSKTAVRGLEAVPCIVTVKNGVPRSSQDNN